MAHGHIVVRPYLRDDLGGALFVGGVDVGMEEVDHHDLHIQFSQAPHRLAHPVFVEGAQHLAGRVDALGHLESVLARDQRLERADHAVGMRPRAAAELQHVAKSPGRYEAAARDLALEQRIGGGGRAVHDEIDAGRALPGLGNGGKDAVRLVADRGRDLGQTYLAALLVQQDDIGEGPADITSDDLERHCRLRHDFYSPKLRVSLYTQTHDRRAVKCLLAMAMCTRKEAAGCPDLDLICGLGKDALEARF